MFCGPGRPCNGLQMPIVAAKFAVPSDQAALSAALEGLVKLNCVLIAQGEKQGRPTPNIFDAGKRGLVHWQPDEYKGQPAETWDCIPIVLKRGYGDCEDLAAWHAAWLRYYKGIEAKAIVRPSLTPGVAWHCVVFVPGDDTRQQAIVDPSAQLGMGQWHKTHPGRKLAPAGHDLLSMGRRRPASAVGADNLIGAELAAALKAAAGRLQNWAAKVETRAMLQRAGRK